MTAKKGCSVQEALELIRAEISSKIYFCPEDYRTEAHKRQYLRDAFLGLEWSRDPLSRAESGSWSFRCFFRASRKHWRLRGRYIGAPKMTRPEQEGYAENSVSSSLLPGLRFSPGQTHRSCSQDRPSM
eukprot:IDg2087t1